MINYFISKRLMSVIEQSSCNFVFLKLESNNASFGSLRLKVA